MTGLGFDEAVLKSKAEELYALYDKGVESGILKAPTSHQEAQFAAVVVAEQNGHVERDTRRKPKPLDRKVPCTVSIILSLPLFLLRTDGLL